MINGYGDRPCFHHYSPLPAAVAHPTKTMSYSEVLYEVQVLAGVLRHKLGVKKGDRVIIYVSLITLGKKWGGGSERIDAERAGR